MALFLRLRDVAVLLLGGLGCALPPRAVDPTLPQAADVSSSSSHSLTYFYTAVSEANERLPQFIILGYVDGQLISQYDSNTRKKESRVSWMKQVEEEDPFYWEEGTEVSRNTEMFFRESMVTARNRHNQTGGFHTLQQTYGCELRKDRSKGGFWKYAYDGRDFISLDKETLTWTAANVPAQITKRKWEGEPLIAQYWKGYLEETCIKWLQKYLEYGKETLLRAEHPVGKVTHKAIGDGQETLICHVHGFYPKEIEAIWKKGEEIMEHETFRRNIAPSLDGTYHTWLAIEIDPKERDLYRCHVDHASLPEPLVLAFKEPGARLAVSVVIMLGSVAVLMAVIGIIFMRRWHRKADKSKKEPDCSKKPREKTYSLDKDNGSPVKMPLNMVNFKTVCQKEDNLTSLHPQDDDSSSRGSRTNSDSSTKRLLR